MIERIELMADLELVHQRLEEIVTLLGEDADRQTPAIEYEATTLRLPVVVLEKLRNFAHETRTPMQTIVAELLVKHLKDKKVSERSKSKNHLAKSLEDFR